jgi:glycosyltransferase involved in cell wall biosynthesis
LLPVATRVGGIPDLLGDLSRALLVDPGDAAALGDRLAAAARDREASARMAAALRERVSRDYSLDAVLDRYLALYRGERRELDSRAILPRTVS